ncbi:hypothetical protein ACQP2X_16125 [Actinoplanes sp. CA-131856]
MSILGGDHQWSVAALLESAATAAELWRSGLDFAAFEAWAGAAVPPRLRHYREPLAGAMGTIRARDVDSFLLSYMAICDAALCAPLLPQHARLRSAKPGFDQLMPSVRFGRLLGAATQVAPMTDFPSCGACRESARATGTALSVTGRRPGRPGAWWRG